MCTLHGSYNNLNYKKTIQSDNIYFLQNNKNKFKTSIDKFDNIDSIKNVYIILKLNSKFTYYFKNKFITYFTLYNNNPLLFDIEIWYSSNKPNVKVNGEHPRFVRKNRECIIH